MADITQHYLNKPYSDRERWICIYPAYLNSKKTVAEGRRLPKAKCVENPTYQEIRDVVASAGYNCGVEDKLYCRERSRELQFRGRIRVAFKNDDGTPTNSQYPTKKHLFAYVAEMIPKLKSRAQKTEAGATAPKTQGTGKKQGKRKK